MPERCDRRCSTVTRSSIRGKSLPRTEREGVESSSTPSSIRLTTVSAVKPFAPLASPKRVSRVFGISKPRCAGPYALASSSRSLRSIRTTPENAPSDATASSSRPRSDMRQTLAGALERRLAAADRGDHVEPGGGGELGVEPAALPVDVHVDVGPELRAGLDEAIAHPGPARVQPIDRLAHGRRLDLELPREPGEERRQGGGGGRRGGAGRQGGAARPSVDGGDGDGHDSREEAADLVPAVALVDAREQL